MEIKDYLKRSKELFKKIEEKLDEFETEIDYDYAPGKLEIGFETGGPKMVINIQQAIQQVWLAGNGQGWHFQYLEDQAIWFAHAEQVEFYQCLASLLSSRLKQTVTF